MILSQSAQNVLTLFGRALIALLFIPAGFAKIAGFAGISGYIASKGVPLPQVCAALAIVIELGLGLMVLVGWQARWAALGLAIFVAFITPVFHGFWTMPPEMMRVQQQLFFKNAAVLGGLLALVAVGAGGWSLDARTRQGLRSAGTLGNAGT